MKISFLCILPLCAELPYGCYLCPPEQDVQCPWFTGSLLAPHGYVVEVGSVELEPFFSLNVERGAYDRHWQAHSQPHFYNYNLFIPMWVGLWHRWDCLITSSLSWNYTQGQAHWAVNDMQLFINYQLVYEESCTWHPAVKLVAGAVLPIGKYQHLDLQKKQTDLGGEGNWSPNVGIVFRKMIQFGKTHFYIPRFYLNYAFSTPVHVAGFNAYGGEKQTNGIVYPGNLLQIIFGGEVTLNQNWVVAYDIEYNHKNRSRFHGKTPSRSAVGGPSSEQLSIAPAIEYNWSPSMGAIAGIWFSLVGRNSAQFTNGLIAVDMTF